MATYIIIGGNQKEYGPITGSDVRQWISEGRLNEHTPAKAEGDADWRPLAVFPEFADLFAAKTPPPFAPAMAASSTEWLERDYELDIGACISRGWNLVKSNFGTLFLTFLVSILIAAAAGGLINVAMIASGLKKLLAGPMASQLFGLFFTVLMALVMGPLMGGLYYVYLRTCRNQTTGVGDIFVGFKKIYGQLFLGHFMVALVGVICLIPYNFVAATKINPIVEQMKNATPDALQNLLPQLWSGLFSSLPVLLICAIPMIYLTVSFQFTLPLIVDKQMPFWLAMKMSWKMVNKHWFQVFGLGVVVGLVSVAGIFACCIGVLFTIPIGIAATMFAYETIFSEGPSA